jgi:hypothetical protein
MEHSDTELSDFIDGRTKNIKEQNALIQALFSNPKVRRY